MKKLALLLIICFCGQSFGEKSRMGYQDALYNGSYNDLVFMILNSKEYSPSKKEAALKKLDEEVEKEIADETKRRQEDKSKRLAAISLAKNKLNDILLPGLSDQGIIFVGPIADKPDQERDTKVLQDLWQESIKNEYLLIFIETAYGNFVKQYKTKLDFRSMKLATYDNKTLEVCINEYGSHYHRELLSELQPLPFWKRPMVRKGAVVAGLVGFLGYKIYRSKYPAQPEIKGELAHKGSIT